MLASYILAVLLIELTPGPNMAYLATLTLANGRRAGFAAIAGIASGLLLIGLASAAGLAALIATEPLLWHGLRWAGVAYLLWLAVDGWRTAGAPPDPGGRTAAIRGNRWFARGMIVNILNPKAMLFYVALLPRFLPPNERVLSTAILLTLLSIGIATAIHVLIVLLASRFQPWLSEPGRGTAVRRILALGLAGIAIWLAATTAQP